MNKDTAKDYLPLVQALAEGKTIQWMDMEGKWHDEIIDISFSAPVSSYRIKPEPKKQWYRVGLFKNATGNFYTYSVDLEVGHRNFEEKENFICWLTDRIEYTLPEGDA